MAITLTGGTLINGTMVNFSPLAYSPEVWLDASDITTITKDGSDNVSQWDDKSGNGNNATQGTAARQPLYVLADLNGKNVINFDRPNAEHMATSYNWPLISTVFLIARPESLPTVQRVISSYDGASPLTTGEYLFDFAVGTVRFASEGSTIQSASILSVDTPYLVTGTCAGGSGGATELFVNQISRGTGTNASTSSTRPIYIGEDSPPAGAVEYFDGDITEIVIYDSVLSVPQIENVEQYLIAKWGI